MHSHRLLTYDFVLLKQSPPEGSELLNFAIPSRFRAHSSLLLPSPQRWKVHKQFYQPWQPKIILDGRVPTVVGEWWFSFSFPLCSLSFLVRSSSSKLQRGAVPTLQIFELGTTTTFTSSSMPSSRPSTSTREPVRIERFVLFQLRRLASSRLPSSFPSLPPSISRRKTSASPSS